MSKLSFATLTIKKRGDAIAAHLYRHNDYGTLYFAVDSDTHGNVRLHSIRDGGVWAYESTFGLAGPQAFTDLGKIQVEEL